VTLAVAGGVIGSVSAFVQGRLDLPPLIRQVWTGV
jgi:hypothetical protein